MIERQDLIVFAVAANHLNFASAAKQLKVTAPQVSKVISKLENLLHKTLFIRTTRHMRLSEHGAALLPVAQQTLAAFTDMEDLFNDREQDTDVSGVLRINCAHTLGIRVLAKIVATFQRKYPKIHTNIILSDHYEDLIEQNLDMALRIFKPDDSTLMVRKLGDNPVVFCAAPEYLAQNPVKNLKDLKNHRVMYIPSHGELKFQNAGITVEQACSGATASASNGDFLTEIAKYGGAVAVRSKWSITRELEDGSLVLIDLKDQLVSNTLIYAVYPQHKFIPKRLRLWLDHLFAEFPS